VVAADSGQSPAGRLGARGHCSDAEPLVQSRSSFAVGVELAVELLVEPGDGAHGSVVVLQDRQGRFSRQVDVADLVQGHDLRLLPGHGIRQLRSALVEELTRRLWTAA
jgi:hypothetical protein